MMDLHIQFAPLATLERMNDPAWNHAGRTLYDSGSLTLLPRKTGVPLLVDHDAARQVGLVKLLYRSEEMDGPWLCATARVTEPPSWLTRGTPASFAFLPVAESSFVQPGEAAHIRTGWITEISVLAPGTRAAEPRAMVTTLLPAEQPKPATAPPTPPKPKPAPALTRRVSHGTVDPRALDAELRRRCDWLESQGRDADVEIVNANLKRELYGPSLDELARAYGVPGAGVAQGSPLIRRNVGRVLGVR